VERFGWTFAPGDKVMQIENDYDKEVYNGDIGFIDDVDPEAGELIARFDDRAVAYGFGELDTLVPAYAATIHKSQGSEYPAVVIPVLTQHYTMLQRNLLYTGVTRGKRLVVLDGVTGRQQSSVAVGSGRPPSDGVLTGVRVCPAPSINEGRPWSIMPGSMYRLKLPACVLWRRAAGSYAKLR
jgi:exodeoxyribonuclease V alpha subunit